jgi:hypothetical protein
MSEGENYLARMPGAEAGWMKNAQSRRRSKNMMPPHLTTGAAPNANEAVCEAGHAAFAVNG